MTFVEVEYGDGTRARWAVEIDDEKEEKLVQSIIEVIGQPATILT